MNESSQWLRYAKQRNNLYMTDLKKAKMDEMFRLRKFCFDITRPKSERQPYFSKLRDLERQLGYPHEPYNGD